MTATTLRGLFALAAVWAGVAWADAGAYQRLQALGHGLGWKGHGALVQDVATRRLYGTVANSPKGKWHAPGERGCGAIIEIQEGQRARTLHDFTAEPHDGCRPDGGVLLHGGALYGTTLAGGAHGHGTLYRWTPDERLKVLHHFNGRDGDAPNGELLLASDGYLYGTTSHGGFRDAGTLFRVAPDGRFQTMHQFLRDDPAGGVPLAGLTQGTDGRIYGTTSSEGTLFVLDDRGRPQPLYRFRGGITGYMPKSLTAGADGSLYGATFSGGAYELGMLFRWSASGGFEHLHSFNGKDGDGPGAAPVELPDGSLVGVTNGLGLGDTKGTLYRWNRHSGLQVLHTFDLTPQDGAGPNGKVLVASDGAWYGMTSFGGNERFDGWGTGIIWRYQP